MNITEAQKRLENWLSDPHELNHKPFKIKYTNKIIDENNVCYIFKFKKSLLSKWYIAIVSESGTFSEMKEYNQKTELEDAKKILEFLKNYWKQRAEEFKNNNKEMS